MGIRFGWRVATVLFALAGAAIVAVKNVDFYWQENATNDIWLQGDGLISNVDFSSLLEPLPGSNGGKVGIKIYDENNWQIYRAYPSGHLDVFFKGESGRAERLDLSGGWRRDTFPMLFMSVPGRLFVVGYDVVRNVPSGRKPSVSQPGFDVYEIAPGVQGEPHVIASGIDLDGGLDSIVYGRVMGSSITLCAERKCADIRPDGEVIPWSLDELSGYEFVEIAFSTDSTYALARKKWDDRIDGEITEDHAAYMLVNLTPKGSTVKLLPSDGIPFALAVHEGKPSWKVADSAEELEGLLLYEISRMRYGGLIDFGGNNIEGRVTWNQVYYLNGLISIADGGLPFAGSKLDEYSRQRVSAEVDLIARLAETAQPGYQVKRYSLDREPLLFALHLGRIADLLARADLEGMGTPAVEIALANIRNELLTFENTIEHPVTCQLPGFTACKTLGYRQGYPFWADGANVPFNFVSDYVIGLLAVTEDRISLDFASDLLQPFQVLEKFSELPDVWGYWPFQGQSGWGYSDGISLNTPEWSGNGAGPNIAHISYRSMDAKALLTLYDKRPAVSSSAEVAHIKELVSKGMLFPSVNESFYRAGSPAILDPVVARRFSRSTQAWQIQSQVWALSDLAAAYERKIR
ncbi:hypothetical protein NKZ05_10780 [Stutzerimonas stutzeri]|uniref:hypothetical protein n=1 Tax=Stutzerimonas stutzeri TaxID=316 RepID=UPI00387DD5A0